MAKSERISILLIRSGETEWDAAGRLQGEADLPLTESGRVALLGLANDLKDEPLGVILCGPDEASEETARVLGQRTDARVRKIKALGEVNMGLWGGLRDADLNERFCKAWRQWKGDPAAVTPPGGEPAREAEVRLFTALAKAFERNAGKTIGVVLRPIAHALAACWLRGDARTEASDRLREQDAAIRVDLSRKDLEALTSGLKTSA